MKHHKPFKFKHFEVRHDRCAMKVNTDGVLLGAWAEITGVKNALDIGTDSGVIALMLAQRGVETIEAIELDEDAAGQASENFEASDWAGNLTAHHTALQHYQPASPFDLIISNPPYFDNALKTPIANRNLARHNDTLPMGDLMAFAAIWLTDLGKLALILPTDMETVAISTAALHGLYPVRCCYVKGTVGGETKRVMLSFGRTEVVTSKTIIAIETAPLHYSEAYKEITKAFYLAF